MRGLLLTSFALLAFAGNSLLCRLALAGGEIDAVAFTVLRVGSGTVALALLAAARGRARDAVAGSWRGALALVGYALPFALAYVELSAGVGALVLFAAVQATLLCADRLAGNRWRLRERAGLLAGLAGLCVLTLPGASAPAAVAVLAMVAAGGAWGLYTLLGRGRGAPLVVTTGNFVRAAVLLLPVVPFVAWQLPSARGVWLAIASGAVTSGLGYTIWYAVVPRLGAFRAAVVQLAVPVLAAAGGVLLLGERLTPRLLLAGAMVLAGIGLATAPRRPAVTAPR